MPKTLTSTVPETVTLPGEFVFELVAELQWLMDWAWDQLAGRTTSGVGTELASMATQLYCRAFLNATPEEVFAGTHEYMDDPLWRAIEARSHEHAREWLDDARKQVDRMVARDGDDA
jgi:hypothetical protein